jgi:hypothetical protein
MLRYVKFSIIDATIEAKTVCLKMIEKKTFLLEELLNGNTGV